MFKPIFQNNLVASILMVMNCQEDKPKPNPAISIFDLLREDIVMCSSNKFVEVSFS
jgi:hypothetical protein